MPLPPITDSKEAPISANDLDCGQQIEHLLKRIASLESCNMALLNKLNHAEKELAALRQSPTDTLKKTESTYNPEQSYGWERKLTRLKWQPI